MIKLSVKAVSVTPADLPMLMPPFIDQFGASEDKALASELLRITREMRVLLGQFFLYAAMSRSKDFGRACNASEAREGRAIVLGSLLRSMVVSTAALFDDDPRTSNIPKIVRTALMPARSEFLNKFHAHYDVVSDGQHSLSLLVKYGRKLKRGGLRDAIQAVAGVRNMFVAHFDMEPDAQNKRAVIRDLDHVISAAAIVVAEANVYVLGRRVDTRELRRILRKEAGGFVETLKRGFP